MLQSSRRLWRAHSCASWLGLCAAALLCSAAAGLAQSQQSQTRTALAGDAAATAAVQRALEAMGGESGWAAVRSSRVQVSVCPAMGKSACAQRTFVDDWSGAYPRYKRGNGTYRQNAVTAADGSRSYQVKLGQHTLKMPEFDAPRVLAAHLPAAALAYVLDHPNQYVLRAAAPSIPAIRRFSGGIPAGVPASSGLVEVDVFRLLAANGPAIEEQQWFFFAKTGLPSFARIRLPNLTNGTGVWQRYDYKNFAQIGSGLLAPGQVKVTMPNGSEEVFNFSQPEMNPALTDADFAFGGQQ